MFEFIHIPKTAGTSICTAIGQRPGHQRPGHHFLKVNQDAYVFSCIRNPYDRAVSIYYFLRDKAPHYKSQIMVEGETVNTYWQERVSQNTRLRFTQPQASWIQHIERIDKFIRFETLTDDWAEMQKAYDLPDLQHHNANTFRPSIPWQEELTDQAVAKIGELYSEDFERFGYDRL